jgi:hypothetical protein
MKIDDRKKGREVSLTNQHRPIIIAQGNIKKSGTNQNALIVGRRYFHFPMTKKFIRKSPVLALVIRIDVTWCAMIVLIIYIYIYI